MTTRRTGENETTLIAVTVVPVRSGLERIA